MQSKGQLEGQGSEAEREMVNAKMRCKLAPSLTKIKWSCILRGCVKNYFSRQSVGNKVGGRKDREKKGK